MTPSGTLLVSMTTAAGVMLMLLGVCLVVVCRRRKPWSRPPLAQSVGSGLPPHASVSAGDSTSALINDPDRLALIAFADGLQVGQVSSLIWEINVAIYKSNFSNLYFASPISVVQFLVMSFLIYEL